MTTSKPLPWAAAEPPAPVRWLRGAAAALLRAASALLARLAERVAAAAPPAARVGGTLEFYAEAGAPEGALYLDGELVGHLPGVQRL